MDILAGLIPTFGNLIFTIIAFVVALSVIIAIHEYGHYIVGKWTGIKAEVFSLGFGPVLASRVDKHGTRWQVAALPFGGYVKFLGDGGAASNPDEEVMAGLSDDERLIREFILQLKLGRLAAAPFRQKFGVDIISRFGSTQPISQLISQGMIAAFIDGLMAILTLAPGRLTVEAMP